MPLKKLSESLGSYRQTQTSNHNYTDDQFIGSSSSNLQGDRLGENRSTWEKSHLDMRRTIELQLNPEALQCEVTAEMAQYSMYF